MRFPFDQIVSECPEVRQLCDDARSIAANERTSWYRAWIGTSSIFYEAISKAAKRLRVAPNDIRSTVRQGLIDEYLDAKRRLAPRAPSYGRQRDMQRDLQTVRAQPSNSR